MRCVYKTALPIQATKYLEHLNICRVYDCRDLK